MHRFGRRTVLVLQRTFYNALPTRIVAPVDPSSAAAAFSEINPVIDLPDGGRAILQLDQLAVVRAERLGRPFGNIDDEDRRILSALDRLFCGV